MQISRTANKLRKYMQISVIFLLEAKDFLLSLRVRESAVGFLGDGAALLSAARHCSGHHLRLFGLVGLFFVSFGVLRHLRSRLDHLNKSDIKSDKMRNDYRPNQNPNSLWPDRIGTRRAEKKWGLKTSKNRIGSRLLSIIESEKSSEAKSESENGLLGRLSENE